MCLNEFTQRCLRRCKTTQQLEGALAHLKPLICASISSGDIDTRDWSEAPLPSDSAVGSSP